MRVNTNFRKKLLIALCVSMFTSALFADLYYIDCLFTDLNNAEKSVYSLKNLTEKSAAYHDSTGHKFALSLSYIPEFKNSK